MTATVILIIMLMMEKYTKLYFFFSLLFFFLLKLNHLSVEWLPRENKESGWGRKVREARQEGVPPVAARQDHGGSGGAGPGDH